MQLEFQWDAHKRKYVTEEERMAPEAQGNQLLDIGTRWKHLVDMREIWQCALANLEQIRPGYVTTGDKKLKEQLESAVFLIDRQINLMARYDLAKPALMRDINAIPPIPKVEDGNQGSN